MQRPIGFRRVDWVEVRVRPGRTEAVVHGVANRLPVEQRVPLSVAARLAEEGVRVVVIHPEAA